MPGRTNINIQPAIAIYIGKGDAGIPFFIFDDAGFFSDIFKLKISFVEIEFIGAWIGCEEYIG